MLLLLLLLLIYIYNHLWLLFWRWQEICWVTSDHHYFSLCKQDMRSSFTANWRSQGAKTTAMCSRQTWTRVIVDGSELSSCCSAADVCRGTSVLVYHAGHPVSLQSSLHNLLCVPFLQNQKQLKHSNFNYKTIPSPSVVSQALQDQCRFCHLIIFFLYRSFMSYFRLT